MNRDLLSRRSFLHTSAGVAASAMAAKSYAKIIGSNDRFSVGLIGAGGQGLQHLNGLSKIAKSENVQVVAVADCWKQRAEQAADQVGGARSVQDYRELLDIKDVDYVTIATPEHNHALIALASLDAGKHVYCEKPLTHTIPEALKLKEKTKSTKLAVQVGVQGMSDDSYASAGEAIRKGLLGTVVQAQIEYVRRYNNQGLFRDPSLKDDRPKPADLDWPQWLAPAQSTSWNPHHYFEWRNYSAYSGCIASDLFVHRLMRIMKACDLLYPHRVVGMGGIWHWQDGRDMPDNFEMICEYPRGMTVYVLGTQSNRHGIEHCIRGYRGTLYFTDEGWIAKDKDDKVLAEHKKTGAEDLSLHHANLLRHLRTGEALNCPVELGAAAVAASCMANESWRTGRMMAWNAEKQDMVPADSLPRRPVQDPTAT
jgi:predicted dehydrogenase